MPSPRLLPMPPLMLMPTTDTADMLPMPTPDTVPTDTDIPGMVDTGTSARGPLMPSPRLMPLPLLRLMPVPTPDTVPTDTDTPGMVDTGTSARGPLMPRLMLTAIEATDIGTEATDIGTEDTGPDTSTVKRNFFYNAMCARVLD